MTRRRLGWVPVTAVGVLVSTGAPIGWSLIAVTAVPEPVR